MLIILPAIIIDMMQLFFLNYPDIFQMLLLEPHMMEMEQEMYLYSMAHLKA